MAEADEAAAFMESPDFMYPGLKEDLPATAIEGLPEGGWPAWMQGEFSIAPAKSCPDGKNVVNFDGYLKAANIPWALRGPAKLFSGQPSWVCEFEDDKCFFTGIKPKKAKHEMPFHGQWAYYTTVFKFTTIDGKQRNYFEKVEIDGEEVMCWTIVQLRWSEATKKVVKKPIGDRVQLKITHRRWSSKDAKGNECVKFDMTIDEKEGTRCVRYMRKVKDASGAAIAYND